MNQQASPCFTPELGGGGVSSFFLGVYYLLFPKNVIKKILNISKLFWLDDPKACSAYSWTLNFAKVNNI